MSEKKKCKHKWIYQGQGMAQCSKCGQIREV